MTSPGYIRVQKEGVQLAVRLQPRAARNEIREAMGDELKISVTAPPVDAAANEALLRLLADKLVELEHIDSISYETVRQVLKKTNLSLG